MKKLSQIFFTWWRTASIVLAILALAYLLFFHNLGQLLPGYAPREVATYRAASSAKAVLDNPVNAPYELVVYGMEKLGHHTYLATRIAAATFAVGASFLFFLVARKWYTYRIAFLATVLFSTSAGFLHVARLGSPLILQMGVLLLVFCKQWWDKPDRKSYVDYIIFGSLALLWYIPGMIWFEVFTVCLLHKQLLQTLHTNSLLKKISIGVLCLVVISPLIRASILTPSTLLLFAGLPAHLPTVSHALSTFANSFLSLGVRSPGDADLWLGHAPLLNVIEIVMVLLGIYSCFRRMRRSRYTFIFGATALGLLLVGLGGAVSISVLLPLLYMLAAGGMYELLQQWFVVFPRNPIARLTGVFFICVLVFFSVLYQFRAYFIAWPHNTATRQTFDQHDLQ